LLLLWMLQLLLWMLQLLLWMLQLLLWMLRRRLIVVAPSCDVLCDDDTYQQQEACGQGEGRYEVRSWVVASPPSAAAHPTGPPYSLAYLLLNKHVTPHFISQTRI
jgi:hypothetical protein